MGTSKGSGSQPWQSAVETEILFTIDILNGILSGGSAQCAYSDLHLLSVADIIKYSLCRQKSTRVFLVIFTPSPYIY